MNLLTTDIIARLSESRIYNYSLISLIPVLFYVAWLYSVYSGNLKQLFRINKTNLLWLSGLFLVWALFLGFVLLLGSIFDDLGLVADRIKVRSRNMNWNRYLPLAITLLGLLGLFVSSSNTFSVNITITKKITLFVFCLLPVVCTIYFLQQQPLIDNGLIIKLCIKSSLPLWILSSIVILKRKSLRGKDSRRHSIFATHT